MTLTTIDAAEGVATKPFLQQVIEAIYQSPLAFGLQGDWLHYRTAEVFINISTRQNRTKARSWTIHAQIRSHEGELLTTTVVAATLAQLDQTEPNIYQLDEPSHTSSLIFREVQPGVYCLSIVLPEQEIIIRRVEIGSDN